MTHGSLFAGIGGFDLGFQRAGINTIWQVEIDTYCQKVLAKNFPKANRYLDIRDCGMHNLERVDIISGGFPCQDISIAGKKKGIKGERSGIWSEMFRICCELRPKFIIIENVPNLIRLGLERVLADIASIGYDAEWTIISARDIGAPHLRKRLWIIAYPHKFNDDGRQFGTDEIWGERQKSTKIQRDISNSESHRDRCFCGLQGNPRIQSNCERRKRMGNEFGNLLQTYSNSDSMWELQQKGEFKDERERIINSNWWQSEPPVGRVANGIPNRVDRIRVLGNAIVPQIAEIIGNLII